MVTRSALRLATVLSQMGPPQILTVGAATVSLGVQSVDPSLVALPDGQLGIASPLFEFPKLGFDAL